MCVNVSYTHLQATVFSLGINCLCVDLRINSYFASSYTRARAVQCKFHARARPNDLHKLNGEEVWAGWLASMYF